MTSSWLASFVLIVVLLGIGGLITGALWVIFLFLSRWDERLDRGTAGTRRLSLRARPRRTPGGPRSQPVRVRWRSTFDQRRMSAAVRGSGTKPSRR